MARTNFKYEKRQKELAKQAKAEEKRLRKLEKRNQPDGEETIETPDDETLPADPVDDTGSDQDNETPS